MIKALTILFVLLLSASLQASDKHSWNEEQVRVFDAMEQLSETTAIDGAGADAYAALLADDFSRWTVGSNLVNDKAAWVDGVRGWFDDGWRVADRRVQVIDIIIQGGYAFTRRNVEETYLGPDAERSVSSAALAEVWIKSDDRWLLGMVNVHPQATP